MPQDKNKKEYKTCIHCINWYFNSGSDAYSEQTPGTYWYMGCNKDHFMIAGESCTEKEMKTELLRAPNCTDFEDR